MSALLGSRRTGEGLVMQLDPALEALEPARVEMEAFLQEAEVGTRALYQSGIALEELFVNVVRHGLAGRPAGGAAVEVSVSVRGSEVVLAMEDDGPAFDPTTRAEPSRPASLADAEVGGLGISLVRKAASGFEYQRRDGRNRVVAHIPIR